MLRIWHNLDGSAYYMKLTRQFNGTFSRLFNTEYKQLISDLRLCKKDGKKPSYNEAITLAERLSCYQQKCREYSEAEAPIKVFLGAAYKGIETEWDYITGQLSTLESIFSNDMSFGTLGSYSDFISEQNFFADYSQKLKDAFAACDIEVLNHTAGYFDKTVLDIYFALCPLVLLRLNECLHEIDRLDNWCHFRSLLSQLDDKQIISYINVAISHNIEPKHIVGVFQKQFYYQW